MLVADRSRQLLWVSSVIADSPAYRAGIREGDVITHVDGEPVVDGRLTMHRIAMLRPGEAVNIALQREQQSLEVTAIIGTRSQSDAFR
jgi:serine protease DegS